MRSIRKASAVVAVGALVLAGALTACSGDGNGGGSPTTASGGVTKLNLWARLGDYKQTLVDNFNASHPDIQVTLTEIPDDQFVNKVGTGVRSSNGPDVIDFDDANAALFAATGVLADITDRMSALDFVDALNVGQLELGVYDGKNYSLPFITGGSFLLYNKELFAQAGLPDELPTTWAEIRSDAEAVRGLGGDIYGFDIPGACGGCLSFTVQPLIWASGGTTMTDAGPDQATTYASSPQVAEAFEFYRDMWQDGLANPAGQTEAGATWGQDFLAGKVGVILAGAWIAAGAKDAGLDVGYGPIPGKDGDFATFAGGDNIGIAASSKNQDAAWTFLTWLYGQDEQMEIVKGGEAPVRSDQITDEIKSEYPVVALNLQIAEKSKAPNSIAYNALQLAASSPWLAAFQAVVFQGADVASTLQKADDESRDLITQAYEQTVQ